MYLEGEFANIGSTKLEEDHPLYWLEKLIRGEVLYDETYHEQEHDDILESIGLEVKDKFKLNYRPHEGIMKKDRTYHIIMHLRHWKNNPSKFPELQYAWEDFEKQTKFNVDDITLPVKGGKNIHDYMEYFNEHYNK